MTFIIDKGNPSIKRREYWVISLRKDIETYASIDVVPPGPTPTLTQEMATNSSPTSGVVCMATAKGKNRAERGESRDHGGEEILELEGQKPSIYLGRWDP